MHRRAFLATGAAAALGPAVAAPAFAQDALALTGENAKLRAMLDGFFEQLIEVSPETATSLGLDKGERAEMKSRLDDVSPGERQRNNDRAGERLAQLKTIDRTKLTGMSVADYDVMLYQLERRAAVNSRFAYGYAYGNLQPYVITQRHGAYQEIPDFLDGSHTIETREDADAYLARLRSFPQALGQDLEVAKIDAARGVVAPSFALDTALGQLEQLRNTPAADSVMVKSLVRRTAEKSITGDYAAWATKAVEQEVYP
ncbi:MAG: DUF885 family protein, partial [Caulobacteraceae bacterium]